MPSRKTPKLCFDRILEGQALIDSARLAIGENPANIPIMSMLAGPFSSPQPIQMALETRTLWKPGRSLRVCFLDGDPRVQEKVEEVAHTWEQHANIKFVFGDDPDAEIRISFIADPGSWSYLGTDALSRPKNEPTMNYGWLQPDTPAEEFQRVVLHEFGHALGCIHEHQSPAGEIPWNKPAVYRSYAGPPNFWPKEKVDVNFFQKYALEITQFSEFDPQSIMLYPIPKEFTDGVFEVGWNKTLSQVDRDYVGTVYPFDTTPTVELAVDAAPTEADIGQHGEEDHFHFVVSAPGAYAIETGGRTDVVMGLYGPDDHARQIAHDDDSGRGLNARIAIKLEPGAYSLRIRHFRPRGTGKYTVSVTSGS
ncbi:MAG: hypothetical protein JXA78_02960 [Anaerolineales bacterium]|nr:hypothetical protein [Anaerolineales bacterium]